MPRIPSVILCLELVWEDSVGDYVLYESASRHEDVRAHHWSAAGGVMNAYDLQDLQAVVAKALLEALITFRGVQQQFQAGPRSLPGSS